MQGISVVITSLPNLLTLSRIGVIPAIVALFWVDGESARWAMLALFTLAALTDFFDGYAARSMGMISNFGRFLDPVADKLLVSAVLLMLVAFDRIVGLAILPALVIRYSRLRTWHFSTLRVCWLG